MHRCHPKGRLQVEILSTPEQAIPTPHRHPRTGGLQRELEREPEFGGWGRQPKVNSWFCHLLAM